MTVLKIILAAVALAALLQSCASLSPVTTIAASGRVDAIYIEEYAGLFVDERLAADPAGKPRWARITLDPALADGRSTTTASVDAALHIERGDRIELQIPEEAESAAQPATVTAITARNSISVVSAGQRTGALERHLLAR